MKKRIILVLTLGLVLLTGCREKETSILLEDSSSSVETATTSEALTFLETTNTEATVSSTLETNETEYIYWNTYPDGVFAHNVNSKVYSQKNVWVRENGKWYYQNQYGIRAAGWLDNNGNRYYMESDGGMYTGWKCIGGTKYYFDPDYGYMLCSTTRKIDGTQYSFDCNGRLMTKVWVYENNRQYYIKSDGTRCRNGFFFIGTDTYYADANGFVVTNTWLKIDGITYYFYSDGHMAKNTFIEGKEVDRLGHLVE